MRLPLLLILAARLLSPSQTFAIAFADGLVHVINAANSYPFDQVIVNDGPGRHDEYQSELRQPDWRAPLERGYDRRESDVRCSHER